MKMKINFYLILNNKKQVNYAVQLDVVILNKLYVDDNYLKNE
jgi:hypothetical protein